jgi:muramoyltetrapeptide carboxypeptidase LdcA involved in peptidoglycan recycling
MNWKWIVLGGSLAILLWLLGAQWWYDIHNTIVLHLEPIVIKPTETM